MGRLHRPVTDRLEIPEVGRGDHGAEYSAHRTAPWGHTLKRLSPGDALRLDNCYYNWCQGEPCTAKGEYFATWCAPAIADENSKLSDFPGGERRLCSVLCEEHGQEFARRYRLRLPGCLPGEAQHSE